MFSTPLIVLIVLWLLGVVTSYTLGGLIQTWWRRRRDGFSEEWFAAVDRAEHRRAYDGVCWCWPIR
jgi:hypothetical protein